MDLKNEYQGKDEIKLTWQLNEDLSDTDEYHVQICPETKRFPFTLNTCANMSLVHVAKLITWINNRTQRSYHMCLASLFLPHL